MEGGSRVEECCFSFFFFKQKTAYEIGTGDWSSDVCSSDLFPSTKSRKSETTLSAKSWRPAWPSTASKPAGVRKDRKSVV